MPARGPSTARRERLPYRETQNYVTVISRIAGPAVRVPGTKIYKIVSRSSTAASL